MALAFLSLFLMLEHQKLVRLVKVGEPDNLEVYSQTAVLDCHDGKWVGKDLTWSGMTRLTTGAQNDEKARLLGKQGIRPSRLPWPLQGDFVLWFLREPGGNNWGKLFDSIGHPSQGQPSNVRISTPDGVKMRATFALGRATDIVHIEGTYKFEVERKTQSGSFRGTMHFHPSSHNPWRWSISWKTDPFDRTPALTLLEIVSLDPVYENDPPRLTP